MADHSIDDPRAGQILGLAGLEPLGLVALCLEAGGAPEEPGARAMGKYDLFEELGRGGMGVVYRAVDRELGRPAAVKLLLAGEFAGPAFAQRFRQEAQVLARLRHPHIVSIYEAGEVDELAFYSMELVEGESLEAARLELKSWKECARFLAKVARAVHYAHGQGVLHRDLKPSNILWDHAGEPRVTDFGLARLRQDAAGGGLTQNLEVLGSPPYLSPEQAAGQLVGVGADVYSLGGVLYFLLTNRPPFQSTSLTHLLAQVAQDTPLSPRRLDPSVPPDLETVALKCLAKDPTRRYPSAEELAEELERYALGMPVRARPLSPLERGLRWARRKPAWAAMLALLTTVVTLGSIGTSWQWRRAVAALQDQVQARQVEALTRQDLEQNTYAADMQAAALAILGQQQLEIGRKLLGRHAQSPLRGIEWRLLMEAAKSREVARLLPDHDSAVAAVALWEESHLAASADGTGRVRFWDWEKKACARVPDLKLPQQVNSLDFLPSGELLVGCQAGQITAWQLRPDQSAAEVGRWPGKMAVLSGDGAVMASSEGDFQSWTQQPSTVRVWSPRTTTAPWVLPEPGQWIALSPDGRLLAVAGGADGLTLWDVRERRKLPHSLTGSGRVWRPVFSPDGQCVAACGAEGAWWWDPAQAQPDGAGVDHARARFLRHPLGVWAVRFLPGSRTLISACADRVLRGWNLITADQSEPPFTIPGSPDEIWCLALSRDGTRILTGTKTGSLHVWLGAGEEARREVNHYLFANPHFSPDSSWLATSGDATRPGQLWDLRQPASAPPVQTYPLNWQLLGFDASLDRLALWSAGGDPPGLRRSGLTDLTFQKTLSAAPNPLAHSGLSTDGTCAYSLNQAQLVHILRLADGKRLAAIQLPELPPIVLPALSAGGQYLAVGTAGNEGRLLLITVATGEVRELRGHRFSIGGVAFSPDGCLLASVASDAKLKFWDTASGRETFSVSAHLVQATGVAWSPDGRTIATLSEGEGCKLWHVATGRELAAWPLRDAGRTLAFSPDGHWLAIGLQPVAPGELARQWLLPAPEVE